MATSTAALMQNALELFQQGKLQEAEEAADAVLDVEPGHEDAMLLAAVSAAKAKRFEVAVERLTRLTHAYPNNFDAWNWLARAYRTLGDTEAAKQCAKRAVELRPDHFDALNNLGDCLMADFEYRDAAVAYGRASELAPKSPLLVFNYGRALAGLGRLREAEAAYLRCLALSPGYVPCFLELAELALALSDFEAALKWSSQAVQAAPTWTAARLAAAKAQLMAGNDTAAESQFAWVQAHDPAHNPYLLKGLELQTLGRFDDAKESFDRSVSEHPLSGAAYYAIVSSKTPDKGASYVTAIQSALANPETLPWDAARLRYALGKVHENLGEFDLAMDQFDEANRIVEGTELAHRPFSIEIFSSLLDWTAGFFGNQTIEALRTGMGAPSELPLFIIGQIRSGTTLLEQIVGSHPLVASGGELALWNANASECIDVPNRRLKPQNLEILADEYLMLLSRIGPDKLRVTDKNPENYLSLGLIHLTYPNARILCLERNALDVCLSVWTTPMSPHPPWANGREGIVAHHRQYLRLMEHWKSVLPTDRLMFVSYEDLVNEREATTREVIEFCGLEWDDACLYPERNAAAVSTPSLWQVRQPVYASSMERWKNYENRLGAFSEFMPHRG